MSEHATSRAFSVALGIGLLVLTAVTVKAAFINLGPFNPVVALLIATIKATLVVLFFMHVKGASERLTGVVVVAGFFSLAILLSLSMADYLTRTWRWVRPSNQYSQGNCHPERSEGPAARGDHARCFFALHLATSANHGCNALASRAPLP
jgi:cytochrome c oxidase subunit 4